MVYLLDGRGWYYRYSHLSSIDPAVKPGARIKIGQKIGVLGKEGASGGWSHLHFDIVAPQPSGKYGISDAYAFFWQAYQAQYHPQLQAVARPHHLAWAGDEVVLDGSLSWSVKGPGHIARYQWTLSDGRKADGAKVTQRYPHGGEYSEILKVTDDEGRVDYDFAVVQSCRPRASRSFCRRRSTPLYWPTFDLKAGDEVTFRVRSFEHGTSDGKSEIGERWNFGDGTPPVEVHSVPVVRDSTGRKFDDLRQRRLRHDHASLCQGGRLPGVGLAEQQPRPDGHRTVVRPHRALAGIRFAGAGSRYPRAG